MPKMLEPPTDAAPKECRHGSMLAGHLFPVPVRGLTPAPGEQAAPQRTGHSVAFATGSSQPLVPVNGLDPSVSTLRIQIGPPCDLGVCETSQLDRHICRPLVTLADPLLRPRAHGSRTDCDTDGARSHRDVGHPRQDGRHPFTVRPEADRLLQLPTPERNTLMALQLHETTSTSSGLFHCRLQLRLLLGACGPLMG